MKLIIECCRLPYHGRENSITWLDITKKDKLLNAINCTAMVSSGKHVNVSGAQKLFWYNILSREIYLTTKIYIGLSWQKLEITIILLFAHLSVKSNALNFDALDKWYTLETNQMYMIGMRPFSYNWMSRPSIVLIPMFYSAGILIYQND